MNIPGVYHLISHKRQTAAWQRLKAKDPTTCPRIAHEANADAEQLEAESVRLEGLARSSEALIPSIELLIHDMATSSHQSPDRTLARRSLEEASMRLRRELGDKPEN
jgi:hypothetical protein